MKLRVAPAREQKLTGSLRVPSDKSVTQRALILAALAEGTSRIVRPLDAGDTRSVRRAIERLGAIVVESGDALEITAPRQPELDDALPLDLENSGTGARLLLGALAGRGVNAEITGDASLRRRPMGRVVRPLALMGAAITGEDLERLPLRLRASAPLDPFVGSLEIASAQVKSAVLLAAIGARGESRLHEPRATRAHTENLLAQFGAKIRVEQGRDGARVTLCGPQRLTAATVEVPADPSAAAFHVAMAAARPGSSVEFPELLLDDRRCGFFEVVKRMGARVERRDATPRAGERIGTLIVAGSALRGTDVEADEAPDLIDELPLVAVLGALARGTTRVRGAAELRLKESDRIHAIGEGLARLGARIWLEADGFVVEGGRPLRGAEVDSFGDHRIAMALVVAALAAEGETIITGFESADGSYPRFLDDAARLLGTKPFTRIG